MFLLTLSYHFPRYSPKHSQILWIFSKNAFYRFPKIPRIILKNSHPLNILYMFLHPHNIPQTPSKHSQNLSHTLSDLFPKCSPAVRVCGKLGGKPWFNLPFINIITGIRDFYYQHSLISTSRWCNDRKSVSHRLSRIDREVCVWQLMGLEKHPGFFFFVPVISCFRVFCARLTSLSTRPVISRAAQQVCIANICTCSNKEQRRLETREEIKAWVEAHSHNVFGSLEYICFFFFFYWHSSLFVEFLMTSKWIKVKI